MVFEFQGCDGEDDCFADILNDDIVKLDESSLSMSTNLLEPVATESKVEVQFTQPVQGINPDMLPSQGAADRRIKLRRHKEKKYTVKPLEAFKVEDEICSRVAGVCTQSLHSLMDWRTVIVVILIFLVLFLYMLTDSGRSKILVMPSR